MTDALRSWGYSDDRFFVYRTVLPNGIDYAALDGKLLVNDRLEGSICVLCLKHTLGGVEENHKSISIAGLWAEIQTLDFQNAK
jgi:hypothetical protein